MASKVIVLGAANGKLRSLFSKLAAINAKSGPFSFAVLLGDLFNEEDAELEELLAGKIKVPIECFATVGQRAVPEKVRQRIEEKEGEICENLVFIGTSSARLWSVTTTQCWRRHNEHACSRSVDASTRRTASDGL